MWNINTTRQQLISSLMMLGAFISSGTAGFVAAKLGRKSCLWIAALGCCVANIIMMATTNIEALYVGRFLIGLANGYFMTFSQLYIQESSPAKYRGLFVTAYSFCTSIVGYLNACINLLSDLEILTVSTRERLLAPSSTGRLRTRREGLPT